MINSLLALDKWRHVISNYCLFIDGLSMTLKVAAIGLLSAIILGTICGIISTMQNKPLKIINKVYVQIFQNTPLVVQLFFYYNGFPLIIKSIFNLQQPYRVPKFILGVLAVTLYHGAYISEIVSTGINELPKGQKEAALSQGLSPYQVFIYILIPQTLKLIMPSLSNQALNLLKNTSILAVIAGNDLMYYADIYVSNTMYLQGFLFCAALYFVICFPIALLSRFLEKASLTAGTRKGKILLEDKL